MKATFTAAYASGKTPDDDPNNADILIYREPTGDADPGTSTIHWIKLEKGNRATDWTAAPGTMLEYVASAFNGWQAVKIGSQVGWVSGEFSEIITE